MKKKVKGIESKKNLQFAGLGVVLIGLFLISVVVFADTSSIAKHDSGYVYIEIEGVSMSLENAIKKGYYLDETNIPQSSDSDLESVPSGGHDASQIFVNVNGNMSSLLEAINYVYVNDGCEAAGGVHVGSECQFDRSTCPEGWHATGYTTTIAKICSGLSSNNSADKTNWNSIEKCIVNVSTLEEEDSCITSGSLWSTNPVPNCTAKYEVEENETLNISEKCLIGICKSKITQISCEKDAGSTVTIGLCGNGTEYHYTKDIFVGHSGDDIWIDYLDMTLQEAINAGIFCYTYSWGVSGWSACSVSCGGGTQNQTVWCENSDTNLVDDKFCDEDTRPEEGQDCNTQACCKSDGESCSSDSQCCGGYCCGNKCQSSACCTDDCTEGETMCEGIASKKIKKCKTDCDSDPCTEWCTEGECSSSTYCQTEYDANLGVYNAICYDSCTVIGGCTCFVSGTKVLMADGSLKSIEDVVIGEKVIGMNGNVNTVLEYERPVIGSRSTYILNNEIEFTGDHPFLTTKGWKVADLELFNSIERGFEVEEKELSIGDVLITKNGYERVDSLVESRERPFEEIVYDFILDGDHTFIANDYVVHNCVGGP